MTKKTVGIYTIITASPEMSDNWFYAEVYCGTECLFGSKHHTSAAKATAEAEAYIANRSVIVESDYEISTHATGVNFGFYAQISKNGKVIHETRVAAFDSSARNAAENWVERLLVAQGA
jgi:hypothetical protein